MVLASDDVKLLIKRGWAFGNLTPAQYEPAEEDFARALKLDASNAEAHTGLGYVRACREAPADAQHEAAAALLHGGGDYLILHNIACIYARLSRSDKKRETAYQDLTIDLLRRAVDLWGRREAGPDERDLIARESAFPPALKAREEFRRLLEK